jgi:hypothetical protein
MTVLTRITRKRMRNKSLKGTTSSLKVKVVFDAVVPVEGVVHGLGGSHGYGVSILLLHYCSIPGIG